MLRSFISNDDELDETFCDSSDHDQEYEEEESVIEEENSTEYDDDAFDDPTPSEMLAEQQQQQLQASSTSSLSNPLVRSETRDIITPTSQHLESQTGIFSYF